MFQRLYYFLSDVVVDDVLKVDEVEIVSPWVKHTETLMLNPLMSVLLNVFLYELVGSFVSRN